MHYNRQNTILEIIASNQIETQQQLTDMLIAKGFEVTQATVSRDIKKLQLAKQIVNGKSCYVKPQAEVHPHEQLAQVLQNSIISVDYAENIVVIKTLSGCANATAEAIDMQKHSDVLGTIAGDNTIFLVVRSKELIPELVSSITGKEK